VKNTKNLWITILLFLFSCRSQQQIDVDVFDNFESRQVEGGFLLYDLRAINIWNFVVIGAQKDLSRLRHLSCLMRKLLLELVWLPMKTKSSSGME